jgi:ankyrin repeat protein
VKTLSQGSYHIHERIDAMASEQALNIDLIAEFVQVSHGDFGRVRELLAQYPDLVNATAPWQETPIQAAAHVGNRVIAEYLLTAGAPLDICTAAMLGQRDRVADMLQADPGLAHATGAHGIPLLFYPALTGDIPIAELLLSHGAEINAGAGGNTPLHAAAMVGHPDLVRWLLDHGADPRAGNYDDKTPQEVAQQNGHEEVASLLAG